jgi:hypothetical protein
MDRRQSVPLQPRKCFDVSARGRTPRRIVTVAEAQKSCWFIAVADIRHRPGPACSMSAPLAASAERRCGHLGRMKGRQTTLLVVDRQDGARIWIDAHRLATEARQGILRPQLVHGRCQQSLPIRSPRSKIQPLRQDTQSLPQETGTGGSRRRATTHALPTP